MTKFYIDNQGRYIGGYDGAEPPSGSIEVATAPGHASDTWDGAAWAKAVAVPTEAQIVAGYMAAVQEHLDDTARQAGYDHILAAISYAEEPAVPRYQAEGRAFRTWRSQVWLKCEQVLSEFKAGARTTPTTAELIAELPAAPGALDA